MTPRKYPPKLILGPLTGRIYIAYTPTKDAA